MAKTTNILAFLLVVLASAGGADANDSILLEFSSPSCGPCRAMEPVVSELIARGVPVRQVDVSAETDLARRYGIRSTPTYVVVNGGREVMRLTGIQSGEDLLNALRTSPSGPIVPTGSEFATVSGANLGSSGQPQTRLAPLAAHTNGLDRGTQHAFGQQSIHEPATGFAIGQASRELMEALPTATLGDAIERARAATVRLRVHEGRGFGAGTGTIIDTHGDEALVLTCGHLFRDSEGKGRIEVDVFIAGEVVTVEGQLIDYDADDRDIGLVAIRPGYPVEPVRVISDRHTVRTGEAVFSFGCDRGDDPTRRDTTVTGVNKYNQHQGASNIEIAGAPIDGRSGGGLFDASGRLIGVCNAADYKSDLGIYTGPGSIHWQLDRVQLTKLYQTTEDVADPMPTALASLPGDNGPMGNPPAMTPPASPILSGEMIVILRHGSGRQVDQVLTLSQPDAELVERIRSAARR